MFIIYKWVYPSGSEEVDHANQIIVGLMGKHLHSGRAEAPRIHFVVQDSLQLLVGDIFAGLV